MASPGEIIPLHLAFVVMIGGGRFPVVPLAASKGLRPLVPFEVSLSEISDRDVCPMFSCEAFRSHPCWGLLHQIGVESPPGAR